MDANKAMDTVTDLKETFIKQLNCETRMKVKQELEKELQKEEENTFQMLTEGAIPFEIKTEYVDHNRDEYLLLDNYVNIANPFEIKTEYVDNDMEEYLQLDNHVNITNQSEMKPEYVDDTEDYLQLDNYVNISQSYEAEYENSNSKRKKLFRNGNELETVVSSKGNYINILPSSSNNFDGDRGENIESNMEKKGPHNNEYLQLDSELTNKSQKQNTFQTWRVKKIAAPNIYAEEEEIAIDAAGVSKCEQADLTETSKVGQIKNHNNNKLKQGELSTISESITILPCIYERVEETGINLTDDSIYDQPELPETSNKQLIRSNLNCKLKQGGACIMCMLVMMAVAGFCYYFTPRNMDNKRENTTTATDDVPVTTATDGECFYLETNCSTVIVENENTIAREELFSAARSGNITQLCDFLKCGGSVNSHDTNGATLLYIASEKGHDQVAKLLLAYKPLVDKTNSDGSTPLDAAACKGHVNIVQLLLTHNASVDKTDSEGGTPLSCAIASENEHDEEVVKLLLAYNSSVDKGDPGGITPLLEAVNNGLVNITRLLLSYNASVDKFPEKSFSALYAAAGKGHVKMVQLLLLHNASVDKTGSQGSTPLHTAAQKGHVDIVQLLLSHNASTDKTDSDGWTALHSAVNEDRDIIVELLCNAGSSVNAQTYNLNYEFASGSTALHIAVVRQNKINLKVIMSHKAELLKDSNGLPALDISRQQYTKDITKELQNHFKN